MIDAAEAQRALDVAVKEAEKDGQPMSFAIADSYGELVAAARMDGSPARVLRHAIRQAYTSGVMHRDTVAFKKQLAERNSSLDDWGDDRLTTLPGGVAIRYKGEVVGAIGVGGGVTLERDTEIAVAAVAALGLDAGGKA
jgi:uncharacterized protein GlcG (DUF336 family)